MKFLKDFLNPVTKKRLSRFKQIKRASWSLRILVILYVISLASELISNDKPFYVRHEGKSYFPVFKYYPEDTFMGNGKQTRPDYKRINASPVFKENSGNFIIFQLIPYGPYENINPESLRSEEKVTLMITPIPRVGNVNILPDFTIARSTSCGFFFGTGDNSVNKLGLADHWNIGTEFFYAIEKRFQNKTSSPLSTVQTSKTKPELKAQLALSSFTARNRPPSTIRVTFRQPLEKTVKQATIVFDKNMNIKKSKGRFWKTIGEDQREHLVALARKRFDEHLDPITITLADINYTIVFKKNDIRWPHPPIRGHWLGIDSAGRDVLSRIIYGLRISMTFAFLLVVVSLVTGSIIGAIQGYFGGKIDIIGQRLIEIWSAMPFLYVMILMGSIYGRSFGLLLFCYAIFNWIGISYYMRAEFLRLRKQPFVDAAKCIGIPSRKIMGRHIMPNALTPIITLVPFYLVGAIASLAVLDFLGFGLPPPTPSWGELMQQAQQFRWAWWLILYPALAIFVVMLLGVFIGEGVREAFDPRPYSKME